MRVEIPELKRCCCCLPLRRGLLSWIYLKVAFELLVILYIFWIMKQMFDYPSYLPVGPFIILSIGLLISLMDTSFCIIFLISAHRKNHVHMRIYYRYAIGLLIFGVTALLIFIGFEIYIGVISMPYTMMFLHSMVEITCGILVEILLHAYCIILVRSEMLKLERSAKFEFTNHTIEPQCKAQITV